jgi:hypothetical protein
MLHILFAYFILRLVGETAFSDFIVGTLELTIMIFFMLFKDISRRRARWQKEPAA